MKKIISFVIFIFLFYLYFTSLLLDWENERVIDQLYIRSNGIIKGAEPISYKNGHKRAVIFIHGHMETAGVWQEMIEKCKSLNEFDAHALLLPYHGRDLETASTLDNKMIYNYLEESIKSLATHYDSITVIGFSYGGLHLANLASNNKIPENAKIILYAPSTYISSNDWGGFLKVFSYSYIFRNYCNYKNLGCEYPIYESTDEEGRELLDREITLRYRVMPAVLAMYMLDRKTRGIIERINRPFFLIVARDDNRINSEKTLKECRNNSQCKSILFSSGKHCIHYGKHKHHFFETVRRIATSS